MTRRRRSAEAVLERRYRRLLAWYPAAYRTANGEEMLGVAMASAKPGQRWPGWGETVSLVLSALRRRAGGLLPDVHSPAWRDAGTVLILLGPAVLAAANIWAATKPLLPGSGFTGAILTPAGRLFVPGGPTDSTTILVALAAGWAAIAVGTSRPGNPRT